MPMSLSWLPINIIWLKFYDKLVNKQDAVFTWRIVLKASPCMDGTLIMPFRVDIRGRLEWNRFRSISFLSNTLYMNTLVHPQQRCHTLLPFWSTLQPDSDSYAWGIWPMVCSLRRQQHRNLYFFEGDIK